MKRIFDKFRNLFRNPFRKSETIYPEARQASTITPPKESIQEKQARQYNQYRKAMRKRGEQPRSYKAWLTGKHPLHSYHNGTFSPIKPIAVLHRISKDKVLRIA